MNSARLFIDDEKKKLGETKNESDAERHSFDVQRFEVTRGEQNLLSSRVMSVE